MMDIYLEFRKTSITDNGANAGLTREMIENSIRWKLRPSFFLPPHETEGAVYDIYPIGIYNDPDPLIFLTALIVKAVYREDPNIEIVTQEGGFVPVESTSGNIILDIPLHITIEMTKNQASINLPVWGINNISPMEGGIRAELNGYQPWTGDPGIIATARLEQNTVHHLYEYIPFYCNPDFAITTTKTLNCN